MIGICAALALIIVGAFAFTFFTGRLGFGPLSAKDKAAAKVIAAGVEAPDWADTEQVRCAADDVVGRTRSGGLEKAGTIKAASGETAWTYAGTWTSADANAFGAALLTCSDDWGKQLGEEWSLDDTGCLEKIGTTTIGAYLGAELAEKDPADSAAVRKLDDCYAEDPEAPSGTAEPTYRGVTIHVDEADVPNAEAALTVDGRSTDDDSIKVEADEGGDRVCAEASITARYGWGTKRTSESTQICGKAKPKTLKWAGCTASNLDAGDRCFRLVGSGFRSVDLVTGSFIVEGRSCPFTGGCKVTAFSDSDGKLKSGKYAVPKSVHITMVATVDGVKARVRT